MLDGITVLNKIIVYKEEYNLYVLYFIVGISAIVGFLMTLHSSHSGKILGIWIGGNIGLLIGTFFTIGTSTATDEILYTKYQVTISDNVNFNEFHNKYEILDQDGSIYMIKEKSVN